MQFGLFLAYRAAENFKTPQQLPIVDALRYAAKYEPHVTVIDDLRSLPKTVDSEKKNVIILLHGLLSTDIGTFEGFVRKFKTNPLHQTTRLIGWPHDTLCSITENGEELVRVLSELNCPNIVFVCHSRGGLVARSAARYARRKAVPIYKATKGILTFGTPHLGANLAAVPDKFIGYYLAFYHYYIKNRLSRMMKELGDDHMEALNDGIKDLRPPINSNFISSLSKDEEEGRCPMFVVGGNYSDHTLVALVLERFASREYDDLVVETRSAVFDFKEECEVTECNHFGYFTEEQIGKGYFDEKIFRCLREWLP